MISDDVANVLPIAVLVIQSLIAWVIWSMRHTFATKVDLDRHREETVKAVEAVRTERAEKTRELEASVNSIKGALEQLRDDLRKLPSSENMAQLGMKLTELHGDLKAHSAELKGMRDVHTIVAASLDRVNEYLLNSRKSA